MKNTIALMVLAWVLMAVDCGRSTEDCHYAIEVRNGAVATYYVLWTTEALESHLQTASPFLSPESHAVEGGGATGIPLSGSTCWEGILEHDSLWVYSFHDSLAGYEWETIVNEQLFSGPDIYTLNDLRTSGFRITIPG